jgi:hypothetical protein
MNRFVLAVVLCGLTASALPALAQEQQQPQQAAGEPTPAPNTFSDPAMSFTAGTGWYKAQIPPHDPVQFDQPTIVAAFIGGNRNNPLTITITMENFEGSLSGYEMVTENTLRNKIDGVFFKKKELTTLSNGMPAYFQDITMGSGFNTVKRFQYVWVDGVRGIQLSLSAHYGAISEDDAKKALAQASAVAYPRGRE